MSAVCHGSREFRASQTYFTGKMGYFYSALCTQYETRQVLDEVLAPLGKVGCGDGGWGGEIGNGYLLVALYQME